jgi:hypothetical protein
MMTLSEFFDKILPLLLAHTVDRIDKDLTIGKVTAYWAGTVLRIDIKPNAK